MVQTIVPVDLVITAADTVNMNRVTIHLLDGTNVGPLFTFPITDLTSQFGTTVVPGGSTRTFPFRPVFICGARRPVAVAADITFVIGGGRTHRITVTGLLP